MTDMSSMFPVQPYFDGHPPAIGVTITGALPSYTKRPSSRIESGTHSFYARHRHTIPHYSGRENNWCCHEPILQEGNRMCGFGSGDTSQITNAGSESVPQLTHVDEASNTSVGDIREAQEKENQFSAIE